MRDTTFVIVVRRAATLACLLCAIGAPALAWKSVGDQIKDMGPVARVKHLSGLIAEGKVDPEIHFHLGNAYFALEQVDSALANFNRATRLKPDYAKAWVNLGILYDGRGQYGASQQSYKAAIEANPKDVLAYCHLGHSLFSRGQVSEAIEHYLEALDIDPNSAQAHYNLGLAFAESKVFAEAIVVWRKVIELDPDGDLGRVASENLELINTYLKLEQ